MQKKLCFICGLNQKTSNDHLPPKAIFIEPYPRNLITVPACTTCNNGRSVFDTKFAIYLSLFISNNNPDAKILYNDTIKRINNNHALLQQIKNDSKLVHLLDSKEQFPGFLKLSLPKSDVDEAVHTVIKAMVKGYHCKFYGKHLDDNLNFHITIHTSLNSEIRKLAKYCELNWSSDKNFGYGYTLVPENLSASVWLFEFYQSFWIVCLTTPPNI